MTHTTWVLANVRPIRPFLANGSLESQGAATSVEAVDLVISGSAISSITPAGCAVRDLPENTPVEDGRRLLALPGFINAHAHVDKSWWDQPWVSYGGESSTQGRIAHERTHRDELGIPSVAGAQRILEEFLRHGTTATRTHVDVDLGVGLRGIENVLNAVQNLGGVPEVEIVAFPQDGVIRRPGVLALLEEAATMGVRNIGGLDPASIDRDPVAQLDGLFDVADRTGAGIDIHLHDPNELGRFQLELIIERTLAIGAQGRVNIAHGFALGDTPPAAQQGLLERAAEAGLSWSTVAPVRTNPLPWRKMRELGIDLGLGTDGIRDLWNPYGDGDLLKVALGFARLHGLRFDHELAWAVELATRAAAPFVHRNSHGLSEGDRADVVLLDAQNVQDALMRTPQRALVVAGGRIVARDGQLQL